MIQSLRHAISLCLLASLAACGGGSGSDGVPSGNIGTSGSNSSTSNTCSTSQTKDAVRDYMRSSYYWNSQVKSRLDSALLYSQAGSNVETYFNSLLWTPTLGGKDRYSFIYTAADYSAAVNAEDTGFGVTWAWVTSGVTKVVRAMYVEPGSPGAKGGIVRGDTLVKVNAGDFTYGSVTQAQVDALYPSKAGTNTEFGLKTVSGVTKTVRLSSALVDESPVLLSQTLTAADGKKVGYLVFNTFMAEKGLAQMQAAFKQFKADGIADLVLDLRYNGGGSLDIARAVGGLIAGEAVRGKTFYRMIHNSNLSSQNQSLTFNVDSDVSANLNLSRVFVLTGSGSASASEAVIYGLKPFVNVIQIGETSYGKPVGMYVTQMCGDYYFAINFEGVNAKDEGGYYSGITPTCSVADDLNHELGNSEEALLSAALGYRSANKCASASGSAKGAVWGSGISPLRDVPLRNNLILNR